MRFDHMMVQGALDEVDRLRQTGMPTSTQQAKALGYRELCRYLEGTLSLEEAISEAKRFTRRYAKRQVTWFRHRFSPHFHITTMFNDMTVRSIVDAVGAGTASNTVEFGTGPEALSSPLDLEDIFPQQRYL